jgi:UDPglucose 6-dehydrogenase
MKITIVGTGYQGLVTGTGLAENGHLVTCVDRKADRVALLESGTLPLHEPGLDELLNRNIEEERLRFSTDLAGAVADSLLVFLCVGTPLRDDGTADISQVLDAVKDVAGVMTGYRIIVNKCTCPPGTTDRIAEVLRAHTAQAFDVVANPDFLKEGAAIDDFMRPDRIIIGCDDVRVREIMKELYSPFLRTGRPFLAMSSRSAEFTKYATNLMLAARISLMNQLASICEQAGANISEVREGLAADDRIGPKYLFPGLGFGGSGLPKDVLGCARLAEEYGVEHDLIDAIYNVNERQQDRFLDRILEYYGDAIGDKKLAVWGLSFKPRTDDIRGAPALRLIDRLLELGVQIAAYDPVAGVAARERYGDRITIVRKYYEALDGADGLIVATEWNEFRRPDYDRLGSLMREKVIFDGRNIYTPSVLREHGFKCFSIGRPAL